MEVKRSYDNKCVTMQIKLINMEFLDFCSVIFVSISILPILILGIINIIKSGIKEHLMALFAFIFFVMVFIMLIYFFSKRLKDSPSRLSISLYDEKELIYCSIYNIYGKKLRAYKFPYRAVADIKLLDVDDMIMAQYFLAGVLIRI